MMRRALRKIIFLLCLLPCICFGATSLSIEVSPYRLINVAGAERWAKMPMTFFVNSSDRLRFEVSANRHARLQVEVTEISSTKTITLFDDQLSDERKTTVPARGQSINLSEFSGGEYKVLFTARSGEQITSDVVNIIVGRSDDEVSQIGNSVTVAAARRFAERSLPDSENIESSLIGKIHLHEKSPPDLVNALNLVSTAQEFVEFQFLGTQPSSSGVDVYRESATGVVKLLSEDGTCSGALTDSDGTVVTNAHCVGEKKVILVILKPPVGIEYTFANFFTADLVRTDISRDLALLRIRTPPVNLKPLRLGKLSDLEVGSDAHAIGHPLGHDWSYTVGTVSQIRMDYIWAYGEEFPDGFKATVIQTQTPSNPGNSGGPLFSSAGELIGINSFGHPSAQGINFAVAVNHVKDLLSGLSEPEGGDIQQPRFLGALDNDGNGVDDFFVFDTDQNGKPDLFAIDENEDKDPDYWLLDENENGIYDGKKASEDYKGRTVVVTIKDLDEDGQPELQGIDFNSDGKIDEYVSLLGS